MTRYDLSRDKRVTIAALVLDVLCLLSFALLADSFLGDTLGIQTVMSNHVSPTIAIIVAVVIQYMLVAVEMIARYREDARGITLPIVFLPGGHILRFAILLLFTSVFLVIRLITYFLSVLFQFVCLVTRLDKVIGSAHIVDFIDRRLEPFDWVVNIMYNLLHYNKIQTNGNVFNTVFNCNLTFWCINH